MTSTPFPIALTIAGSDSGGGAGIQADLKTFHAFGVYGTSVITAVTAQNTRGITSIHPIPLGHVMAQIDAVATDLPPAALKTGMLATDELVSTVADAIRRFDFAWYVMDPVMVATSGDRLVEEAAERSLLEELLPLATVVTPNLEEAAILTGLVVETVDGMSAAAKRLVEPAAHRHTAYARHRLHAVGCDRSRLGARPRSRPVGGPGHALHRTSNRSRASARPGSGACQSLRSGRLRMGCQLFQEGND